MTLFRQFRNYPFQSALIIVALALGVAVVTAVAATLQQSFIGGGNSLWQRQITLQSRANDWGGFYEGGGSIPVREVGLLNETSVTLSETDLAEAKAAAPSVDHAYLTNWTTLTTAAENNAVDIDASGITWEYLAAADLKLIQGSLPSQQDFELQRKVILLPEEMLERLELVGDPVGQQIEVYEMDGKSTYTVVGILGGEAWDWDGPQAIVPYTPVPWQEGPQELIFAVDDPADLPQARAELQAFAEKAWGGRVTVRSPGNQDDGGQVRLMTIVIAAFGSTALAAASLNVMNLMLARVFKARHELGIRRSLGATRASLLRQTLGESLLLGTLGGLLGVAGGLGLHLLYNRYQMAVYGEDYGAFLIQLPLTALLIGFALALLCSLLFGFYPALQASRLRPVEALREVA